MKKKTIAMLMAVMMSLGCGMTAFAAEQPAEADPFAEENEVVVADDTAVAEETGLYEEGGPCGPDATWDLGFDGTLTILAPDCMTMCPWQGDPVKVAAITKGVLIGSLNLDDHSFNNCVNLTSISLSDPLQQIEYNAFDGCVSLPVVLLPSSLQKIQTRAFANCPKLQDITFLGQPWEVAADAFAVTAAEAKAAGVSYPVITRIHTANDAIKTALKSYNWAANGRTPVFDGEQAPDQPSGGFVDVEPGKYYYDAVQWAVQNEITSGTSRTTFGPADSCTRAQAVTFLWRANGKQDPTAANTFSDVPAGAFYETPVAWAVGRNVTSGTSATTFGPSDTCTRAQIVTFLYRAAEEPPVTGSNTFSDVPAGSFYEKAVTWAVENGITNGTGNGQFSPKATCTRAQIVTFLYKFSKCCTVSAN